MFIHTYHTSTPLLTGRGNIRLKYTAHPQTGETQSLEESHYYPFGLEHQGYQPNHKIIGLEGPGANVTIIPTSPNVGDPYKYKFGGKEYQEEFDINVYDFGARNYDAALGRWMNVDPLAEEFFSWNPYHYVHNNPLRFIDPTGMSADDIIDIDKKTGAITITEAAGEDIVRLINNDKVEDSYSYGSNGSFSSDNIIDRNGSDITLTSVQIIPGSIDKAQAFYEFAAQSDVEFGKLDVRSPSGESISIVTTSGETTAVSTLPKLVTDYSKRGFTGVKQSHSHPGTITSYNESVPSGHYDYISGK